MEFWERLLNHDYWVANMIIGATSLTLWVK
ncbi:hypothetical protein PAP10c_2315 [Pantoea agglomerans]|nr:hypothetical protein PAP10c_2315 [Pantoea agglomerans]